MCVTHRWASLLAGLAVISSSTDAPAQDKASIILATTTSTQDSGLFDVLVPMFTKKTGIEVKVIAVGSGAALQMGAKGDADVVLSHAPAAEQKLVDSGALVEGRLVMHNDFIIVGPLDDPATVRSAADLGAVMKAIANHGGFASRGDDSGTHKKELDLWKKAAVDPGTVPHRVETGQGMGATLNIANEKKLYTLTDRATYLALRNSLAQRNSLELVILSEGAGAPSLQNIYHVYVVNPARFPKVKAAPARRFVDFLVADDTQKLIGEFGKAEYGQSLFIPDAKKGAATEAR